MISKIKILTIVLFFLSVSIYEAGSQTLLNNDKDKNGKIVNKGTFRIRSPGSLIGMPDTIDGKVEFVSDYDGTVQIVPNITYQKLTVKGKTQKYADSLWGSPGTKPLATRDSLVVDGARFIADSVDIHAKASVENRSVIWGRKEVRLNGEVNPQTMAGKGRFTNVNLDNPQGADVVEGGGFHIGKRLELTRGELRNDSINNFTVADSILIVRHVGGSIKSAPEFEGNNVFVHYVGQGSLLTGPEIPDSETSLQDLRNETSEGITLSKDITVNDQLYLSSDIRTEEDSTKQHVLTYTNIDDPIFDGFYAEIDGSFRRTRIRTDSVRILFNNPFTWALYPDRMSSNRVAEMTFRVKPSTFPPYSTGDVKVKRFISITAKDSNDLPVRTGLNLEVGYGWRHSPGLTIDETGVMEVSELILQRWNGDAWFDIVTSNVPAATGNEWANSYATAVSSLGDFAIGMPGGSMLVFNSKVYLEGPWRFGTMAMDLRLKNLVPTSPPDMYPYNLDPNRPFVSVPQIPDSVVDWLVLEFRPDLNSPDRFFRTVFLKQDGKIVDLDGISPVLLSKGGIDSGEYFIAVRHRNHLSIVTENKVSIYPETANQFIDFTDPSTVMGRSGALRPMEFEPGGSLLFGMYAGDVNGDGIIDDKDNIQSWDQRDLEGYYSSDANMSGFINTRDFNFTWNNRGKQSNLP